MAAMSTSAQQVMSSAASVVQAARADATAASVSLPVSPYRFRGTNA
jgi:hypothetical protein